jgi:hypothetical protein
VCRLFLTPIATTTGIITAGTGTVPTVILIGIIAVIITIAIIASSKTAVAIPAAAVFV